jgi:hypothetical protein
MMKNPIFVKRNFHHDLFFYDSRFIDSLGCAYRFVHPKELSAWF